MAFLPWLMVMWHLHPEYLKDEPSVLLVDVGGWTVDLMRLDNAVPNAAT